MIQGVVMANKEIKNSKLKSWFWTFLAHAAYATAQAPGGDRGGGGGGSGVYVRYGIAEQQGTGVGTRVYLRVQEAGK